ncbi:MAG: carbon-nitrogen hydrolase family protein [Bryobacteraceae bacterium]
MADPWLPDYIAQWYDDFRAGYPYGRLTEWEGLGYPAEKTYLRGLKLHPHSTAVKIDAYIHAAGSAEEDERRFHALRLVSRVFGEVGFRIRKENAGAEWNSLRTYWISNGNLLSSGMNGYLLPREKGPYDWCWNRGLPPHTVESWFESFARWVPSDHPNFNVTVTVLESTTGLLLHDRSLKIAVVPLVDSIGDFSIENVDTSPVNPLFRVSLRSPDVISEAARNALDTAASAECDVVVFPELCLTEAIQNELGEHLRSSGRQRPCLVVAGSAPTPAGGAGTAPYNQAVVFNHQGRRVLAHHKLHPYWMSGEEESRYGLAEAFGRVGRYEEITIEPFEIQILDTELGRLAVLICEDLSALDHFGSLVVKLGLDWLLVPVLDGCQMPNRWTARFGQRYADKGACVVVATSLSFVKQHLSAISATAEPPGVGVLVVPTQAGPDTRILYSAVHDQPAIEELP